MIIAITLNNYTPFFLTNSSGGINSGNMLSVISMQYCPPASKGRPNQTMPVAKDR